MRNTERENRRRYAIHKCFKWWEDAQRKHVSTDEVSASHGDDYGCLYGCCAV
jgi:hypothetical protein